MTLRRWKHLLWLASVGSVALAGAAGWWLAVTPLSLSEPEPVPSGTGLDSTAAAPRSLPDLDVVLAACRKPLQRPLADPPPPVPQDDAKPVEAPPVVAVSLPPELSLIGTVVEAGASKGVFAVGAAQEIRGAGESLERATGVEVVRVEVTGVQVRYQGHEFRLDVPLRKKLPGIEP